MQKFSARGFMAALALVCLAGAPLAAKVKTYRGAWFEISYPDTFKVKSSLLSSGVPEKYDSAFFASIDGKIRFYIFSPQWAGETPDIAANSANEIEKAEKTEKSGGFTRRWFTIAPKRDGFTRSYVETTNEDKTIRWVVGVEYADKAAYEKYKSDYLKFKKSLKQFAD